MTDMQWEDPPVMPTTSRLYWDSIAAELRKQPGRWALVVAGAPYRERATYIRTGRIAAFRPIGAFEAAAHPIHENGRTSYNIYARYIGGEE